MKKHVKDLALIFVLVAWATVVHGQGDKNEAAIQSILQEEITGWNKGDAELYSSHFATEGTFTNILGMFFIGHKPFVDRHDQIFKGVFRGTVLQLNVVSLQFVKPDVAIVETLCWVSGISKEGPSPGTNLDAKGRLVTRLLQVMVKSGEDWKITAYHNIDIKPGIPVPEPK